MRVRDLAKDLGVSNNEVLDILKESGVEVFNYMSSIDEPQIELVKDRLRPKKEAKRASEDKRIGKRVIRRRKVAGEKPAPEADDAADDSSEEAEVAAEPKKVVRRKAKPVEEVAEVAAEVLEEKPVEAEAPVVESAPVEEPVAEEPTPEVVEPSAPAAVDEPQEDEPDVPADEPKAEARTTIKPKTVVQATGKKSPVKREARGTEAKPAAGGEAADDDSGARIIKTGVKIHEPPPRAARSSRPGGRPSGPRGPRPGMASAPPPPSAGSDDRKRKDKKKKDVKRPKLRVVTKNDKYRNILGDGNRNTRGAARKKKRGEPKESTTVPMSDRKRKIRIEESIMVGDLAKQMGVKSSDIVKQFIDMGMMVTVNQAIDPETATIIAAEYKFDVEVTGKTEDEIIADQATEENPEDLEPRPPVVTVMGHVDHGKTSILDAIRKADVAGGEAGGITQHIGAYQIERNGKPITFIDTPGHAAFTSMRARGAKVTDIVILVVAANDGVMPQTIEAINHAKSAEVPVIVAINKMDVEGANPDKVIQQLSEHGIIPEDWGGENMMVRCSAMKNEGITDVIDAILLQSEVLDLKANPKRDFSGVVLEASLDKGRGPMATVLVTQGQLKSSSIVMVDKYYGRVRSISNDLGDRLKIAGPGTPVALQGLNGVPNAGDVIQQVKNERTAKDIVERRRLKERETELARKNKFSIEDLFAKEGVAKVQDVNLVVKGDVHGSVEALRESLEGLSTDECKVKTIYSGVGAITENDVNLASASDASIIGFNIRADSKTSKLAEQLGVEIRPYSIIYEVLDDIRAAMLGKLAPEEREENLGWVRVKEIFPVTGIGTVAGSLVETGKVLNGCGVRLIREGKVIYEGVVNNLKRFKDDVKEVNAGQECGILLKNHNDVVIGDEMETFQVVKVARTEL